MTLGGPVGPKGYRKLLIVAAVLAGLVLVWAVVNLTVDAASFAVEVSPKLRGGEEAASALARLFCALVLSLFAADEAGRRLHWVAGGFLILGLGHLLFGYLEPILNGGATELEDALYEGVIVRTLAGVFFVVALVPKAAPRFPTRLLVPALALSGVAYVALFERLEETGWLPELARVEKLGVALERGAAPFSWLTPWHWVLAALPLALAFAAVTVGAVRRVRGGELRGWLLVAMVLYAGSVLHEYLWPSTYGSELLTTADLLRLAFAAVAAVGGVLELRRIAAERAALLAAERERARRLDELATLRADFTAMVAHELGNPLAAVRKLAEVSSAEGLDPRAREQAFAMLDGEINALESLVDDVRAAAVVERDDFRLAPRPVALAEILDGAEVFAEALPDDRRVGVVLGDGLRGNERVLADPERIGQVLRNLLSNAAKYSPPGTSIQLRAHPGEAPADDPGRVRIEVVDRGPGVRPEDAALIFEKFKRGNYGGGRNVGGVGLGLYVSRRIVRGHGSELTVSSAPGEGSTFGFDLEVAR